jgi:hypothetical protein
VNVYIDNIGKMSRTLLLIIVFISIPFVCFADQNILPKELLAHAKEIGCTQVEGFYDRPGQINPVYAYGYPGTVGNSSAVFWCEIKDEKEPYQLVVWISADRSNKADFSCLRTIKWINYPGGLKIIEGEKKLLSEFYYRDNPKKKGPDGKYTEGLIIHSTYDGVGADFYCFDGKLLMRQFH